MKNIAFTIIITVLVIFLYEHLSKKNKRPTQPKTPVVPPVPINEVPITPTQPTKPIISELPNPNATTERGVSITLEQNPGGACRTIPGVPSITILSHAQNGSGVSNMYFLTGDKVTLSDKQINDNSILHPAQKNKLGGIEYYNVFQNYWMREVDTEMVNTK